MGYVLSWADVNWTWRPYQLTFREDRSRLIVCNKSRQIGMSEELAFGTAVEIATHRNRKNFFVSTNYKKSKDLVKKTKKWLKILCLMSPMLALTIIVDNKGYIELSNGSSVAALPCKPGSIRGETGTIRLDEADHYNNWVEIYTAVAPSIASNKNLRLIISTSPMGEDGPTYQIKHGLIGGDWSYHEIDVYRAVGDGFPVEVLDLKETYTSDMWAQEFECAHINDGARYFSNTLIRRCFTDPAFWPESKHARHFMGVDVGRVSDQTSWSDLGEIDQQFYLYDRDDLLRTGPQLEMPEQYNMLSTLIDDHLYGYETIGIDATGEGRGLAQFLKAKYGAGTVYDVTQNLGWLQVWIPELKRDMERGRIHLPNDSRLLNGFGKIKRVNLPGGGVTFKAKRTSNDHADAFYSLLQAYAQAKVLPGVIQDINVHVHSSPNVRRRW